jgi:hypothetical protein
LDCIGYGFVLPLIMGPGRTTARLVDFLQRDPQSPNQTVDTSSLEHIGFIPAEPGSYDFCVRDFKFLDDTGVEVTPPPA